MPMYSCKCPRCGNKGSYFQTVDNRHLTPTCAGCQVQMEKVLDAPYVAPDIAGYDCPVSGVRIEGRKAHEENLKRTGCRLLEPGESRDAMRQRAADEEATLDRIAETAAQTVAGWSADKQERLANELSHGLDVEIVRQ